MTDEKHAQPAFDAEQARRFGYWFSRLPRGACRRAGLKVPDTLVFVVPEYVMDCLLKPDWDSWEVVNSWVRDTVYPAVAASDLAGRPLFIRNGLHANKAEAGKSCLVGNRDMANRIMNIAASAYAENPEGYIGVDELAVQSLIEADLELVPTIWGGIPIRPEYRVFYDFDRQRGAFTADLWDRENVEHRNKTYTDRSIYYDAVLEQDYDETGHSKYEHEYWPHIREAESLVWQAFHKCEKFTGVWAIDVLYRVEDKTFWLTGMKPAGACKQWQSRPDFLKKKYPQDEPGAAAEQETPAVEVPGLQLWDSDRLGISGMFGGHMRVDIGWGPQEASK